MTTTTPDTSTPATTSPPSPTSRAAGRNGQTRPALTSAPASRPARQHRRWGLFWIAVALACLAGLGAAYFASQGGKLESIVTVRGDIKAGAPLTLDQLGSTQIQVGSSLHTIPADQLSTLVGKYSTSNLPAGAILTPEMMRDGLVPAAGKAVVGVAFKHGQIPARGLQPGDRVRVVTTALAGGQAGTPTDTKTWTAQVVTVEGAASGVAGVSSSNGSNDATTYDLLVDDADAAALASAVGAGNVAAILEPVTSP